ncbi:hypothetical protein BGP78_00870 [Pseudoalteromonas sp. MSK9-3]|uniref:hypothetical protein n=1 Tax=Pseudoalteromonas sp. MSK9-3 TaxID=1897633 RepID=UPI000E6BAA1D|nr:hypothetical protein [Pseudoalteromonas sp. MSK9-3]RJE77587.1 hypothetical protein BGP78_00870 [Pseudoalteromonas sp. MSK9-3]
MRLKVKKKSLKDLSLDNNALPMNVTPQVGGGVSSMVCISLGAVILTVGATVSSQPCLRAYYNNR